MTRAIVVTGTDTDVGKTVFAAALVAALDGYYWKPVQAASTARRTPRSCGGCPACRPSACCRGLPADDSGLAAPCRRARRHRDRLRGSGRGADTYQSRAIVIEGAGGLLVPLTRSLLQIELFARWGAPVVLVASTRLGTINHSLLSVEALKRRRFHCSASPSSVGKTPIPSAPSRRWEACATSAACRISLRSMRVSLREAFTANFRAEDFLAPVPT